MERKTMPRIMALLLAVLLTCTSIFSAPIDVQAAANPTKITLSATKKTLCVGKSFTLKVKSVNPSNASKAVTYKSNNKKVATVSSKGKVTGKAEGKATITVTSKGSKKVKAKCTVTVKKGVETIQTATSIVMKKGKKVSLRYDITPNKGVNKKLTFKSNKPSVVKVSKKGRLTAKKVGKAKITVKSADGGAKKTVNVTVKKNITPVKLVTLDKNELALLNGGSETLHASVTPAKATKKKVYFVSSNTSVARVNNSGRVVAKGDGTAKIYAYAADNIANRAVCTVTVTSPDVNPLPNIEVPVTGVTLDRTELVLTAEGAAEQLTATIVPANASYKAVTWESSDKTVATVENGLVTPLKAGKTEITVTTADGGKTAKCSVTVNPPYVPVEEVILAPQMSLKTGETTEPLVMAVLPSDATNKAVVWSSDDENIATVSVDGAVSAVGAGTATITVTTVDGMKTAKCVVTVTDAGFVSVTGITVSPKTGDLTVGGEPLQLGAAIAPNNATDKSVVWISADPEIASVTRTGGLVSPLKQGRTIIYAQSANGYKDWCEVTVRQPLLNVSMSDAALTLDEGGQSELIATLNPTNADVEKVEWNSSSDAVSIVTDGAVLADGTMHALVQAKAVTAEPAVVTVTVTTKDGTYSANCSVTVRKVDIDVEAVTLAPKTVTLVVNQTQTLVPIYQPGNATINTSIATWHSNNEAVAKVENGVVTAIGTGDAKITATTPNNKTAEMTVTVIAGGVDYEPVSGIEITNKPAAPITVGTAVQLTATVTPSTATDKTVTWTSGDTGVVEVNKETGALTAVGVGTTSVVASAGGKTDSFTVTVYKALTSVSDITGDSALEIKDRGELSVTIDPADATIQDITWNVKAADSNEASDVVSVMPNGKVDADGKTSAALYAAKTGTAVVEVTVTPVYGEAVTKSITVTVTDPNPDVPLTGIRFISDEITLKPGEQSAKIEVLYTPTNTTENPDVKWELDDPANIIESVVNGVITAKENVRGAAHVTASVVNAAGETLTTEQLTVNVGAGVTGITLDEELSLYLDSEPQKLAAKIVPDYALDQMIYWISVNPEIATVDEDGVVTPVAVGETEIIAVTRDGGLQARCAVKVERRTVESITLDQTELEVMLNAEPIVLNATVDPAAAVNPDLKLTWKADKDIVTIQPSEDTLSATVTLKDIGNKESETVTITVESENGKSAECTMTVIKKVDAFEVKYDEFGDPATYIYTLDKNASEYEMVRDLGDGKEPLRYSILQSYIAHDYDWLMSQFKPENYDNNFLKNYWNKFDWNNLVNNSFILQELIGNLTLQGESVDVKVTSQTTITVTIKKGGKTKTAVITRVDHEDGSDLIIDDGNRKVNLTDIEISQENDTVTINAKADVAGGMNLQAIITRTSFTLRRGNHTIVQTEMTDDNYTCKINVSDFEDLMQAFNYEFDIKKVKVYACYKPVSEP